MKRVIIVMGSDSDFPVVKGAGEALEALGIEYEYRVLSAHRTPLAAAELAENAASNGIKCIIAAAGKAAHLAGVLAAYTTLPIIGIPVKSSTLDGLDSLLSTVQMPKGIPVATVAIDGAYNAGILAAEIIALSDENVAASLLKMRKDMTAEVLKKDEKARTGDIGD